MSNAGISYQEAVNVICAEIADLRKRAERAERERDFLRECIKEIRDGLQESAEPFDRAARIAANHATKEE